MLNSTIIYGPINNELQGFLNDQSYTQIFVLVDENTKQFCLPKLHQFNYHLIEIHSGEAHKRLETCQQIWQQLLDKNADRKTLLINLGGGVISDMGGFCASTFKRGIDFINIPTTLLAMVDATIGGKTGIDFNFQKNMIGLFSIAKCVFVDDAFLKTLDKRQIKSGKAEMLKHGLITNEKHFEEVLQNEIPNLELIQKSISIKQAIVKADPYEKGLRKSLNFGHTLGHALETYYLENNKDILHGEAIAQGIIWAMKLSVFHTNFDQQKAQEITNLITSSYGEIALNKKMLTHLISLAKNDKKNQGNLIEFVLLESIGQVKLDITLTDKEILEALI